MSVLGYEGGYLGSFLNDRVRYHSGFGTSNATGRYWYADSTQNTTLNVSEKGSSRSV